jgi:hypothetical protein
MGLSNYNPPVAPVATPRSPSSPVRRWVYLVISLLAIPIVLIGSYIGYVEWDIANVRSVCRDLKPGVTISGARKIIADHGFAETFPYVSSGFPNGIPVEPPGTWWFAIPAATTMGDVSCGIHHNGKTILSAEASGP